MEFDVEKVIREIREHAEEIKKLMDGLEFLKKYGINVQIPDLQDLFSGQSVGKMVTNDKPLVNIWPDTFAGMEAPSAAEKYLESVGHGHAVPFDEIYDALMRGGFDAEKDKDKINKSLTRATFRLKKFRRGKEESFGLRSWYPERKKTINEKSEEGSEDVTEMIEETNVREDKQNESSEDALRSKTE